MARGWATQEKARGEIERLTGWRIPQSVYAEWESGRRTPTEANLERLREFYGHEETGPSAVGEAGLSELVAALRDQTRAMDELVSELRELRVMGPEVRERVAAIEAYAAEHELRLQADRRLRGLEPEEAPPSLRRPLPAGQ